MFETWLLVATLTSIQPHVDKVVAAYETKGPCNSHAEIARLFNKDKNITISCKLFTPEGEIK